MVRKASLILALALALAGPAAAQTNTRCTTNSGITNCETTQQPGINWGLLNQPQQPNVGESFMKGFQEGQARQAQQQALQAQRNAYEAEAAARLRETQAAAAAEARQSNDYAATQQVRVDAGRMAADGDCDGAERYALRSGQIQVAQELKTYCASR